MAPPRARVATAALGLLALAACGGEADDGAGQREDAAREQARIELRPGLWEVSSEILSASQEGLPTELAERARGRRREARHCLTPEQAARPDANALMLGRSESCTHEGFAMRGGRIADVMTCRAPDGAVTRARVSGRYGPEAYEMQLEIDTPGIGAGRNMRLVTRQTGRRVGNCPARAQGESRQ